MAIIKTLERIDLDRDSKHTEVDATYAIVEVEGQKYLQIELENDFSKQDGLVPEASRAIAAKSISTCSSCRP